MKRIISAIICLMAVLYISKIALPSEQQNELNIPPRIAEIEPVVKGDRILIMAPHPDDETIGVAGIIQKALASGAEIRVLYLTNGEHNQLSFILYERRIVIKKSALISMGEIRHQEAIDAMKALGLSEDKLIFLGYPDFGTFAIFLRYWGGVKPFQNMMLNVSRVPYKDALSPNAPYKGESVLGDMESVLKKYKPTKIFVTNPVDSNRDHRALYLFLRVALLDLRGKIPEPKIFPYLIHCYGWPVPRNYHPENYMPVPKLLKRSQIEWRANFLSEAEVKAKYNAICLYKSQCAESAFYLKAFARKNELFGDYPVIDLAKTANADAFKVASVFRDKIVVYGRTKDKLVIHVAIKRENEGKHRFFFYLVGYNPQTDFARMPKLKINVDMDKIKIMDKSKIIPSDIVCARQDKRSITLILLLKDLGDPEYVFSSVNTYMDNFSSDLNAWRTIKIK